MCGVINISGCDQRGLVSGNGSVLNTSNIAPEIHLLFSALIISHSSIIVPRPIFIKTGFWKIKSDFIEINYSKELVL
jgi:hypothetical protein